MEERNTFVCGNNDSVVKTRERTERERVGGGEELYNYYYKC